MQDLIPGIRVAVRAVIVNDAAVLVQHKAYEDGSESYCLPGGGIDLGETLAEGLIRECREEIGCEVEVQDLLHVADYFKLRDTEPPTRRQQVEFLFRCGVPDAYEAQNGPHPDKHQKAVVWLNISDLCHKCFTPPGLSDVLGESIPNLPTYLGLID